MDGTLTVAAHDFSAIRRELGLPENEKGILETISLMPAEAQEKINHKLHGIEMEIARNARPSAGIERLLELLISKNCSIAIVTRNDAEVARVTLKAAGLKRFFKQDSLIDRNAVPPKPDPAGISHFLNLYGFTPKQTVMTGDYRYDLEAARNAGVASVYYDSEKVFPFRTLADLCIGSFDELTQLLTVRADRMDDRI